MPGTLRVLWTIRTSTSFPKPVLRCSRCDQPRPFAPSGKFRLNANGKRLDAWLVYRCETCKLAWNRPIFERKRRSEIDGATIEALQCNDPALAHEIARDGAGLARWTARFAGDGDGRLAIDKTVLGGSPLAARSLAITVSLGARTAIRCDRLLAAGLSLSRSRVAELAAGDCIKVDGFAGKPLARSVRHGTIVTVALCRLPDAARVAHAAAGWADTSAAN